MKTPLLLLATLLLAACGDSDDTEGTDTDACTYPAGATDPMAVDAVLTPYSWPNAIHGDGRSVPLDLSTVPCATDDQIDWSPFEALVFVSIPAW